MAFSIHVAPDGAARMILPLQRFSATRLLADFPGTSVFHSWLTLRSTAKFPVLALVADLPSCGPTDPRDRFSDHFLAGEFVPLSKLMEAELMQ
jgi:hypothetical protein